MPWKERSIVEERMRFVLRLKDGESMASLCHLLLQFRAEFFNIFNHPNFALPSNVITPGFLADHVTPNPDAGIAEAITQTPDVAQGNPGLGAGGPRVMQFGLRLQF